MLSFDLKLARSGWYWETISNLILITIQAPVSSCLEGLSFNLGPAVASGGCGGQWWPVVANSGRHRDDRLDRKVEETWKFPPKGLDKIVKGRPEKSPLHKKGNGNLLWQVFVSAILDKMLPDPLAPWLTTDQNWPFNSDLLAESQRHS